MTQLCFVRSIFWSAEHYGHGTSSNIFMDYSNFQKVPSIILIPACSRGSFITAVTGLILGPPDRNQSLEVVILISWFTTLCWDKRVILIDLPSEKLWMFTASPLKSAGRPGREICPLKQSHQPPNLRGDSRLPFVRLAQISIFNWMKQRTLVIL